jgi:hypothetical protein
MRHLILVVTISISLGCSGPASKPARGGSTSGEIMDPRLQKLATIPTGIEVTHAPNPVPAQKDGRSGRRYTWQYNTNVKTKGDPITVEEFGAFTWHNDRWVFANYTGEPFSGADFAEWYSCPGAKLLPGKTFTDPTNWTGGDTLSSGKMKWYFIGRDANGNKVKGEGVVETLPQVVD